MSKDPVRVNHHVQHRYPLGIRFCPMCAGKLEERILLPDGREHKVCSECGFVHFLGPKLVSGCLVVDDDRVLLLRRGIEPEIGKWTFPGGFVDFGETPVQAALRETLEEVGMQVRIGRHLGLYADPANPHAAVAVYLATPGGEQPGTSDEALEVRFFSPAEIPWDDIAFLTTREALRDWIAILKSPLP
jgi:8-oxo-dGTP diphosphatase